MPRMTPDEYQAYLCKMPIKSFVLTPVAPPAKPRRDIEAETLHKPFGEWCALNNILAVHSRTDKATTTERGVPDFVCMAHGKCVCVEFKRADDALAALSDKQKEWMHLAYLNGTPYLATNDLRAAMDFCREKLQID